MHTHLAGIADDDVLIAAFHQVEAACRDLGKKGIVSDFTMHIAFSAPDNPAFPDGLRREKLSLPGGVDRRRNAQGRLVSHAANLP
ncbi:hypothetical protein M4578_10905 [Salipiger sp. P9]|uniref:hypothetical protein n=1 Tax=Salipiger pentaromativorans TaxID=2943193 RepID=UPI002157A07A|nr:hypothetical protein [Salipiger pentaromativorans]MCR8548340.1 hypothetical protein [Salipiger pentaromativorans]